MLIDVDKVLHKINFGKNFVHNPNLKTPRTGYFIPTGECITVKDVKGFLTYKAVDLQSKELNQFKKDIFDLLMLVNSNTFIRGSYNYSDQNYSVELGLYRKDFCTAFQEGYIRNSSYIYDMGNYTILNMENTKTLLKEILQND